MFAAISHILQFFGRCQGDAFWLGLNAWLIGLQTRIKCLSKDTYAWCIGLIL